MKLIQKDAKGSYHTARKEALNRYEIALKNSEIFHYNKDLIMLINEIKQKALRPKNVVLDITKLKRLIISDINIYCLEEGLKDLKNNRIYILYLYSTTILEKVIII